VVCVVPWPQQICYNKKVCCLACCDQLRFDDLEIAPASPPEQNSMQRRAKTAVSRPAKMTLTYAMPLGLSVTQILKSTVPTAKTALVLIWTQSLWHWKTWTTRIFFSHAPEKILFTKPDIRWAQLGNRIANRSRFNGVLKLNSLCAK
jgi:hypothetical protein